MLDPLATLAADPTLITTLMQLALGAALSMCLQFIYVRYGTSLSNRENFGRIFPLITLAVIVVISVVKTSLALSLGLVGALSIVRFRTPIKEPEELAYIFLAIAIGIGLGADQVSFTVVSTVFILILILIISLVRMGGFRSQSLYVTARWKAEEGAPTAREIAEVLSKAFKAVDIRRVDANETETRASFHVEASGAEQVFALVEKLRADFPGLDLAVIEHQRVPGA